MMKIIKVNNCFNPIFVVPRFSKVVKLLPLVIRNINSYTASWWTEGIGTACLVSALIHRNSCGWETKG